MAIGYRDRGAIGALLDEYEKAIRELIGVVSTISDTQLMTIVDTETSDPDCVSVQSILTHVIRAGYYYADTIRSHQGEQTVAPSNYIATNSQDYSLVLEKMFAHTVRLFDDYPSLQLEEYEPARKIKSSWGQSYNVEQMMEHAIVHVLRHRRQIERFMIRMK